MDWLSSKLQLWLWYLSCDRQQRSQGLKTTIKNKCWKCHRSYDHYTVRPIIIRFPWLAQHSPHTGSLQVFALTSSPAVLMCLLLFRFPLPVYGPIYHVTGTCIVTPPSCTGPLPINRSWSCIVTTDSPTWRSRDDHAAQLDIPDQTDNSDRHREADNKTLAYNRMSNVIFQVTFNTTELRLSIKTRNRQKYSDKVWHAHIYEQSLMRMINAPDGDCQMSRQMSPRSARLFNSLSRDDRVCKD